MGTPVPPQPAKIPSLADMKDAGLSIIGRHLAQTFAGCLTDPRTVREAEFTRLVTGEIHPFGNFAVIADGCRLPVVERAVQPLRACAAPSAVIFTSSPVPGVDAHLSLLGFQSEKMPAMAIDIVGMAETAPPAGTDWVRVLDSLQAEEWTDAFAQGYEIPPGVARAFAPGTRALDPSPSTPIQYFMIRREGRAIATSLLFLSEEVAGIYCVSTVPAERRKGLGACATIEALHVAGRNGYGVGVLQASKAGYPLYRCLGFQDFGGIDLYIRLPA